MIRCNLNLDRLSAATLVPQLNRSASLTARVAAPLGASSKRSLSAPAGHVVPSVVPAVAVAAAAAPAAEAAALRLYSSSVAEVPQDAVALAFPSAPSKIGPLDCVAHTPVQRKIGRGPFRQEFIHTMRAQLEMITMARSLNDPHGVYLRLVQFMRLFQEMLTRPARSAVASNSSSSASFVDSIPSLMAADDAADEAALASILAADEELSAPASDDACRDVMTALLANNARRAARQMTDNTSRAIETLGNTSTFVHDISAQPDIMARLQELHPPGTGGIPPLSHPPPSVQINGRDVKFVRFLRSLPNGSSGGPSGMTYDHLAVLAEDDECVVHLARFMADIINGTLPSRARQLLTASNLFPLAKPDGGVRPVAVGEVLLRASAAWLAKIHTPAARKLLLPIQFGVGVSNGAEKMVHQLQHALEHVPMGHSETPLACISIDFKNAFNTLDRGAMIRALFSHSTLAPLFRFVHASYDHDSTLYTPGVDDSGAPCKKRGLYSCQGARQGDPLGTLLFCVGVDGVFRKALEGSQGSVRAMAYVDDLYLVGAPDKLLSVYTALVSEASKVGLTVASHKCKMIYFHGDKHPLSDDVRVFLEQTTISLHEKAVTVLGSPIGVDGPAMPRAARDDERIVRHVLCLSGASRAQHAARPVSAAPRHHAQGRTHYPVRAT